MRCADKMQHWLAETLAGRAECDSHAKFFIFWLNAPAVCVLMQLSGLGLADYVSGNVFVEYASCLCAVEFFCLKTDVAQRVSSLLT